MGASDKNECPKNNCDPEVDDGAPSGVQLLVVAVRRGIQMVIKLALEEVRLEDHSNKDGPIQAVRTWHRTRSGEMDLCGERQIGTIGNSGCE